MNASRLFCSQAVAVDALGNAVFSDEPTNRLMRVRSACLKCIKLQEAALSWAELLQRLKGFTQELKRLWPQEHAILAQECSFEHLRHVQSNAGISMELGLAHSDIKISSLGLRL